MSHRKGRFAVYLITPPPDWRPQRPWDWPLSGVVRLHERNLTAPAAIAFCRVHNADEMKRNHHEHEPIQGWAICCYRVKPRWHAERAQGQRGGVA